MASLKKTSPVMLIIAATYKNIAAFDEARTHLETEFGPIDLESTEMSFDHSDYYREEMGADLKKRFLAFANLMNIENIVSVKLFCMNLEAELSTSGKRSVNLDPGYLELAKLVVATAKNFDHRIHIGHGVYGDVQLRYRKEQFVANEWTYADYRTKEVTSFLQEARSKYFKQVHNIK